MVMVTLWGSLKSAAGGTVELEIEAGTIKELLDCLGRDYPDLQPEIDRGIAVSINGVLYRDNIFTEIPPDAEVFLLPRMEGG